MTLQTLEWRDYHSVFDSSWGHHISGEVQVARAVYSPQLENERDLLVYLPPSYRNSNKRYPVIYMQDGQNLFDHVTSFAGEWGVDETMEQLAYGEGLEAIIVGVPNMGRQRVDEYSPFRERGLGGGKGDDYVDFLVETVKPRIDAHFRTVPDRKHTGIMGSSLGGYIALYGFLRETAVFGLAGIMSPSLWFAGGAIFDWIEATPYHSGKIYLDVGTRELGEDPSLGFFKRAAASRRYYASVRRLKRTLVGKGYRPVRDIMHVEDTGAGHSESYWARRLGPALRFLLTEAYREAAG